MTVQLNCLKRRSLSLVFLLAFGLFSVVAYAAPDLTATSTNEERLNLDEHISETSPLFLTVTGTVIDDQGEPLIGVNVIIKGTSTGTVTDLDGKFSLEADADATLVFSCPR